MNSGTSASSILPSLFGGTIKFASTRILFTSSSEKKTWFKRVNPAQDYTTLAVLVVTWDAM